MIQVGEYVNFRVVIRDAQIMRIGCNHEFEGGQRPDICRSCSVGVMLMEMSLECRWGIDVDGRGRFIEGRAKRGDKELLAITRLIALAMGHRDPLELAEQTRQWRERTPLWRQ